MSDVSHVEWRCTDLDAATRFLARLFGWRFRPLGHRFAEHVPPDGPRIGLLQVDELAPAGACQAYVRVDDLEGCLARATPAGAEVECPIRVIPDYGRYARIRIPGGAVIGLFQWS
ncbi:MAG TPA: VOC family protein [Gammaproteobacteria bacterium]|nr:VOC family protein [Gammaproteobacteria bacterium]